jgi:hypothetical protein
MITIGYCGQTPIPQFFILEGLNKLKKNAAPIAPNGLSSFLKNRIAIKKHKTAVIG